MSALATDVQLDATVPAASGDGPALFPLPESFEAGPLRIGIGRVGVKGGDIVIRSANGDMTLELSGPDVTARPAAGDLDVSGRIDTLRVAALGRREQLTQVALEGRLSADVIRSGSSPGGGTARRCGSPGRCAIRGRPRGRPRSASTAISRSRRSRGSPAPIRGSRARSRSPSMARGAGSGSAWRISRPASAPGGCGDGSRRRPTTPAAPGSRSISARSCSPDPCLPSVPGRPAPRAACATAASISLRAQATWRGLAITLGGRLAAGPPLAVRGTLTADLKEIARALSLGALSGHAIVSAALSGRGETPAVEGRAEVTALVVQDHAVEPIEASFRLAASPGPASRWEGTIQSPRIRSDQLAIEQITAALAVDGERLEITRARARVAAVPVEATGVWEWAGSGRSHAELGPVSLGAITGVPPALRLGGTGRATVDASINRGVTTATARATLDQVTAAGVSLGAGQAELRVRGAALDGDLAFPTRRLRAKLSGRVETGSALSSTVELDDLALPPLLRELGSGAAGHVEGRVSARGEASIPLGQPASGRGVLRLTPDGLRLLGESWASQGPIVLRWEGPRVAVERFQLDGPSGRLTATGMLVDPERRPLALALDHARLPGALAEIGRGQARAEIRLGDGDRRAEPARRAVARVGGRRLGPDSRRRRRRDDRAGGGRAGPTRARAGRAGVGGRATLTADARGRTDALEATGALRAPQIQLRGATVTDVDLPLRLTRSSLRLEKGQARLGTSRLSADASATWPPDAADRGRAGPRDADPSRAPRAGGAPGRRLAAPAPGRPGARRAGPDRARGGHASGVARHRHAHLAAARDGAGPAPAAAGRLRPGRHAPRRDRAVRRRVRRPHPRHRHVGVGGRGQREGHARPGAAGRRRLGPGRRRPPGHGRATIDASMRSIADVTGTARAVLEDVAVGGVSLGRGQLDLSARDRAYRADLAFPEPRLRASARGRVDAAGTLEAEGAIPDVDLARLTRALEPARRPRRHDLGPRHRARAARGAAARHRHRLDRSRLRLIVGGRHVGEREPDPDPLGAGRLVPRRLPARRQAGRLPRGGGHRGRGRQAGRARVGPAAARHARREAARDPRDRGHARSLAARFGTLAAPAFVGDGAIHRGSVLLRDRPEALRDIEARFVLSTQGVQVRDATASMGGGRLQAQGDIALQGWQPGAYRFKLQAKDVALGQIEGFSSAWDADLELSGITREAQLTGRARLVRGVYGRDLSVLSLVLSPAHAAAVDPATPLRLRVRVDLDDNLVVRSRTADLRAGGVLTIEGTTARPVVFGSVESRDGRINFRGRDWSVTNATVRFADPRRLDPFLDVLATSRIAEYDVTMQVTGPVSNITVRLSSTPRLSQNDLLSLVAFGATGAVLRESPATVLLSEAGKMLAQNVFGVDPSVSGLRISTGSSADSASELHGFPGDERSLVGPSRNTPGARKETVHVEYQLWAPLYLSGEYDREYGYGADVVFRFRFR